MLALSLMLAGCNSAADRRVYDTLDITVTAVNGAMEVYRSLNNAGQLSKNEVDQIRQYYTDYQAAITIAIDAASSDLGSPTPENVMRLATQLIGLIERIEQR